MVDQKLVDYVKSTLGKTSEQDLVRVLTDQGWTKQDIDAALAEAKRKPGDNAPKKGRKKLIVALIILIILIFLFIYMMADILNYFTEMFPDTVMPFDLASLTGQ